MKFLLLIHSAVGLNTMPRFEDEKQMLEKISPYSWIIKKGFVPNMKVRFRNFLTRFRDVQTIACVPFAL